MGNKDIKSRILFYDEHTNNIAVSYSPEDFNKLGFKDDFGLHSKCSLNILNKEYEIIDIVIVPYSNEIDLTGFGVSDCPELSESRPFNLDVHVIVKEVG